MTKPTPLRDVFRPRTDPARAIYDAFQDEAEHRKGRTVEQWLAAEIDAVHREATRQAEKFGLAAPTTEMVRSAEVYASGSVDYGAKWAYTLVEAMHRASKAASAAPRPATRPPAPR